MAAEAVGWRAGDPDPGLTVRVKGIGKELTEEVSQTSLTFISGHF